MELILEFEDGQVGHTALRAIIDGLVRQKPAGIRCFRMNYGLAKAIAPKPQSTQPANGKYIPKMRGGRETLRSIILRELEGKEFTRKDALLLSQQHGLSEGGISSAIERMIADGVLHRVGDKGSGRYGWMEK